MISSLKKFIGSKRAVVGLCAVLVAVSAFFYAPMDVKAAEISLSGNLQPFKPLNGSLNGVSIGVPFGSGFDDDEYYRVSYDFDLILNTDALSTLRSVFLRYGNHLVFVDQSVSPNNQLSHHLSGSSYIILKGSALNNGNFYLYFRALSSTDPVPSVFSVDFSHNITSSTVLTGEESESYQQGYNAGYSVGEQAGQDIGYSNGYEVGFEQGENQGYESGFEAGKESVDTQSYYDMGYSAGYDAGYLSGYDEGYDEGYDAGYEQAVSNLTKYGADVNTYPIHLGTVSESNTYNTLTPFYKEPSDLIFIPYQFDISSYDIDPNYNYRILGMIDTFRFGGQYYHYDYAEIFLSVGSRDYFIGTMRGDYSNTFSYGFKAFIPGSDLSSKLAIKVVAHRAYGEVEIEEYSYPYMNLITSACTLTVSNLGASSTETNQIANSTDVLENTLEEQKEIQKEQAETQKGIAQSIKDFFGSFFDNLINSIIHVIVPTKEEMGELFNRLNDFFSETFGFLYYPFEFIINAFNIFLVADSGTGLTLPAFSIMGYEVWGSQTYDIASEPIVGEIFGFVRMGTGAMLVMWFVNFLKDFFDKRFGGGGS